ncbi:Probable inactive receptor kinase At2g26730 [Linum grandiflorum]
MNQFAIWAILISLFLLSLHPAHSSVDDEVKNSLISLLANLNGTKPDPPAFGWVETTHPCFNAWPGITCDASNNSITKIVLSGLQLSGVFRPASICNVASSLTLIDLQQNQIVGRLPPDISNCTNLTHLLLGKNKFSGRLPDSLIKLKNLRKLDLSHNNFSGELPDVTQLQELTLFIAKGNHFTGPLPLLDFLKLNKFDVSHNNFSGQIPDVHGKFNQNSFLDNPDLCGSPLPKPCIPWNVSKTESQASSEKSNGVSKNQILMYSGYVVVVLGLVSFIICKMCIRKSGDGPKKGDMGSMLVSVDEGRSYVSKASSDAKPSQSWDSRSEMSSALASSSLVVLTSIEGNGLGFDQLLKAPAELLGRGKHGSLYQVNLNSGMRVVVKRIKNWPIHSGEFKHRMQRIHQATHPNVLPPLAFYYSQHEKLLVYGYQENGSLFRYIHGSKMGQAFEWTNRLSAAATIAEALAFMHKKLYEDGIGHGNLKSSNILLNHNLEACISEYGLMPAEDENDEGMGSFSGDNSFSFSEVKQAKSSTFRADVYGFGVILLQLLTGKTVQNNGISLPKWVHSAVREEWTVEVFDKNLIAEGASEERMLNLLQVAIKCVHESEYDRPSISQVAVMINTIREEDERCSITY